MRIKKFNESNENNVDFNLFDRYINDIRECLLDFEDDMRIKYLINRVYYYTGRTKKFGSQLGVGYFDPQIVEYDSWIERIKNKLILPSDNWIKKQSFLLECYIDIPTIKSQYPTGIKDINDIELILSSIEKIKLKFDDVSLLFKIEEHDGFKKQIAIIGVYFSLKS